MVTSRFVGHTGQTFVQGSVQITGCLSPS